MLGKQAKEYNPLLQLIKVNQPDLVLFVGEALVGNDAIDQLTKFNQSIADHSNMENPRLIDGIVLTKFDTIDDKVRATKKRPSAAVLERFMSRANSPANHQFVQELSFLSEFFLLDTWKFMHISLGNLLW